MYSSQIASGMVEVVRLRTSTRGGPSGEHVIEHKGWGLILSQQQSDDTGNGKVALTFPPVECA